MVLAAGLGERLRPLTESTPKALLAVAGKPLLSIVLEKLGSFSFDGVVVNAHHHAEKIERFVKVWDGPKGWIHVIREPEILGTGGGVKNAAERLGADATVLVHNVDVLSSLSFRELLDAQLRFDCAALLAVADRETSRPLAVDGEGFLCGRFGESLVREPRDGVRAVGFSGIEVLAPGVAARLPGEGCFSIIDSYLRLIKSGEEVRVFPMNDCYWIDLGTPAGLRRVEEDLASRRVTLLQLTR